MSAPRRKRPLPTPMQAHDDCVLADRLSDYALDPLGFVRNGGQRSGGAGTALVGSHAEVADRIQEYHELGIDEFVLSGYPHLEEAYWFGEGVRPILASRGLLTGTTVGSTTAADLIPTS